MAAVLALEVNALVPTDRLVDLLWPHEPPVRARSVVRNHISGFRKILRNAAPGGPGVDTYGSGYLLRADRNSVDAHRFRSLLAEARGAGEDSRRVMLLDEALGLWTGPALSGVTDEEARARLCRDLDDARLTAVEDRARARLRLGRAAELIDELLAATTQSPQRPGLVALLMMAMHESGRSAEALEVYGRFARTMRNELGLDPSAELQNIHMGILRGDRLVNPAPATASAAVTRSVPRQLPADTVHFTGRNGELEQLWASDGSRDHALAVISIDGMAGVGKTALAVHAAHRLADDYPDGQLFLDLHGHTDGMDPTAPAAAAETLRVIHESL